MTVARSSSASAFRPTSMGGGPRVRRNTMNGTLTSLMAAPAWSDSDAVEGDLVDGDEGAGLDLAGCSVEQAAVVVEGELVEAVELVPFDQFASVSVDDVLAAFLDDRGRLVPGRTADLLPLNAAEARSRSFARARELDEIRARAWADSTLRNYGRGVQAWRTWCKQEEIPCLPLRPLDVANHLLDYCFTWDEAAGDYVRNDEGLLVPRVSSGSVTLRLAALNKVAEFAGLPRPGENAGVVEVMRGIRRALGIDPTLKKAALDYSALLACLHATTGATYVGERTRALLLLKARTDATAGQLFSLDWGHVEFDNAGGVTVSLAPTGRAGDRRILLVPRNRNGRLCLARAFQDFMLLSGSGEPGFADRPVFAHQDGRRLSRQAPYLTLRKLASDVGGWDALAGLNDRSLAGLVEDGAPRLPLPSARDRALLLVGFYTASRRSNLSALRWRDLTDYGTDGWKVIHRRSKTDQEGRGHTVYVPESGGEDCPAQALRVWRRLMTEELGRPPVPDEPVFAAMNRHGRLHLTGQARLRTMPGSAINEAIQRLCVAAGIASGRSGERNPYGAHSLRAGFVTESLRDDKLSIAEVQQVTAHKSVDVLMGYHREVNGARRNPARKLIASLGDTQVQ